MTDFTDTDFVYVDPAKRAVFRTVEWNNKGVAKSIDREEEELFQNDEKKSKPRFRKKQKRKYPWCTYRTAKRVYRVEGKDKSSEGYITLDEALSKAIKEPYWD